MIASLWDHFLSGSFWYPFAFGVLSAGVLIPAVFVVFSRNIMHSALWLLPCLVSVAGLFLLLDAELLAAIQILVYCGGIVVLLLFALMLTHGVGHPDMRVRNEQLGWGVPAVGALAALLIALLARGRWPVAPGPLPEDVTAGLADALLGPYVLAFEVASVVLLVAMVGAIVIARSEPKE